MRAKILVALGLALASVAAPLGATDAAADYIYNTSSAQNFIDGKYNNGLFNGVINMTGTGGTGTIVLQSFELVVVEPQGTPSYTNSTGISITIGIGVLPDPNHVQSDFTLTGTLSYTLASSASPLVVTLAPTLVTTYFGPIGLSDVRYVATGPTSGQIVGTIGPVPEPSSLALCGLGVVGLAGITRQRRR